MLQPLPDMHECRVVDLIDRYPDVANLITRTCNAKELKLSEEDKKLAFDDFLLQNGDTPAIRKSAELYIELLGGFHLDANVDLQVADYVNRYNTDDEDFPMLVRIHILDMVNG